MNGNRRTLLSTVVHVHRINSDRRVFTDCASRVAQLVRWELTTRGRIESTETTARALICPTQLTILSEVAPTRFHAHRCATKGLRANSNRLSKLGATGSSGFTLVASRHLHATPSIHSSFSVPRFRGKAPTTRSLTVFQVANATLQRPARVPSRKTLR